jgi:hypothetical protein
LCQPIYPRMPPHRVHLTETAKTQSPLPDFTPINIAAWLRRCCLKHEIEARFYRMSAGAPPVPAGMAAGYSRSSLNVYSITQWNESWPSITMLNMSRSASSQRNAGAGATRKIAFIQIKRRPPAGRHQIPTLGDS